MPFLIPVLKQGFLDIIINPPNNPLDAARKMAQAYADYAKPAASLFGPAVFTGNEVNVMANVLAGGFNPLGAAPAAAGGLVGGIQAFWTAPPVVFGAGAAVAFVGGPALGSCLNGSFTNPRIPAGAAAAKLATCFDVATRLVQVVSGAPPFTSFLI